MCRNHRGFVEALIAANRIGADVLLLNTSFAGPALAEVVNREGVDAVDLRRGVHRRPSTGRWPTDPTPPASWRGPTPAAHDATVEKLIAAHAGQQPDASGRQGQD